MIETVFSKSAYGSLKLAQNCGADKHSSASIGLVLSGRTNISPEELETLKQMQNCRLTANGKPQFR